MASETAGEGAAPTRQSGSAVAHGSEQEVRRRHVLYVPGYDPRDPDVYRRLAALELRRFGKLWGANVSVDRDAINDPAVPSIGWRARVKAGEARVEVTYETLRWDDLVAADFSTPLWLKVMRGLNTLRDALFSGQLYRIARAAPWCAIVWLYPPFATFGSAAVGAALAYALVRLGYYFDVDDLIGLAVGSAAVDLGIIDLLALAFGSSVMVASVLGVLGAMRRGGSFVMHLIDDGRSQRKFIHRADPALDKRVDAFAARIRAVKAARDVDELLVVGHSSGTFLAIDAVTRAYDADPEIGKGKPALALLTVGATELLVALHPKAGWFREKIRRLAVEPTLFWAEVYGPWDVMNFPARDPVEELKLDVPAEHPNPTFRRAFLGKMLKPDSIDEMKRALNLFRLHFQFIMSNEVQGPYDYFGLICGPWRARTQFRRTRRGALMSPHLGPPVYPPAPPK